MPLRIPFWSIRCEIRSGPEYVIRHLKMKPDHKFESTVYLYSDPDCHHPLYAVHSNGSHALKQASWTVRGGTEAKYEIYSSYLIPYTHNAMAAVSDSLSGTGCYGLLTSGRLLPYREYLIYSIDPHKPELGEYKGSEGNKIKDNGYLCFQALNFTLNELQLVMLELNHRRLHHHRKHHRHPHHHRSHVPGPDNQNHNQHHHYPHHNQDHVIQADAAEHRENVPNYQTRPRTDSSDRERLQMRENQNFTKTNIAVAPRDNVDASSWPWPDLVSRELLLGAVHSRPQEKLSHTPSSFQAALKDARVRNRTINRELTGYSFLSSPL